MSFVFLLRAYGWTQYLGKTGLDTRKPQIENKLSKNKERGIEEVAATYYQRIV